MEKRPDCFGILDRVFPVGDSGIREVTQKCMECPYRIECLRSALDTEEGIKMREEIMERVPVSSVGDWIKRWSEKKMLSKLKEEKKESFLKSIWIDFKMVLFSPKLFFSEYYDVDLKRSFIFGLFIGSIGSMFSLFWQLLIMAKKIPSFLSLLQESPIGSIDLIIFLGFLFIPIMVLTGILIYSLFIHIFLFIMGAGRRGLEKTFVVICYSQAPKILSIIPMLGGIVGFIWRIIIQIIGLKYVHNTTYLRVIIAFIIPIFILFICIMAIMSILFHIISGALS